MIKKTIKKVIEMSVASLGSTRTGRFVYRQIVGEAMARTRAVEHLGTQLLFAAPNALTAYRAESFSSKEPETLEWIDGFRSGAVFWDIGANVGLYSCYAAKRRGCKVFSFEPSVFNLELLARNIFLNELTEAVTIIPLPLSESLGASTLNMTSTDWGGAMSTFGQSFGFDGRPIQKTFAVPTIGLSMVDAVDRLGIPQPEYLKMDVDGIEHMILRGGGRVLAGVKALLVEINDDFVEHAAEAVRVLTDAGLTLTEKRHAEECEQNAAARNTYNQIWVRA